ncbi:AfsR/SARP family transcriptional regulator [Streptomyces sp. NPDC051243]|uniref:AfsR/SARP family transcriptional regulator n=1 Tax=Streptomyces sp. NPDC051243 TaxID=3365646 RepID=UPI00379CB6AE
MSRLSFRALGPLRAEVGGEPLNLGGARQRKVLAMLLLAPGQVVSVESLTEAVWQGAPPTTARNQIAICITALRRIFRYATADEELIRTAHNGYSLIQGDHRIDIHEMHSLLARARTASTEGAPEEAAELFEQVLAMWYGSPLEGLAGGHLDHAAARLTELWLDLNEEYAALQLQLGRYRAAADRLATLVEQYPLREQARLHLMSAQHLGGRRADALETYRVGRKVLVEELGIEPGPELQQLHRRILQDSDTTGPHEHAMTGRLTAKAGPPAQLPLPSASFTGREKEIAALDELLHSRTDATPLAIAALSGASGVGKSALAVHWANRVVEHFPDGQLFVDLRGYDKHDQPFSPMSALDSCLRALGVQGPEIPAELQERAALFRSLLDGRRMLIVLDNVRSIDQILPLFPGRGDCCVVITSRDPLGHLAGDYPVLRVPLRPLNTDESCRMLEAMIGRERVTAAPEMAARLAELCDGLPLALRILGAQLINKPHRSLSQAVARLEDRRRRLDLLSPDHGGLRAEFWLSYRELSPDAARMYRHLSMLCPPPFPAWVGAALLDIDIDQAEDLLDQLVDAQLLEVAVQDASGAPRYRFLDLLRLFAWERAQEEEPQSEIEAALDRLLGTILTLADLAHEQLSGKGHIPALPQVPGLKLLPHQVASIMACPMNWFESERQRIVELVKVCADSSRALYAWALAARLVPLFETLGYPEDWRTTSEHALRAAREAGDVLGVGTMLRSLGALAIYQRQYQQAESLLGLAMEALVEAGEVQGQALVLRNFAVCARFAGDLDSGARHCRAALRLFERTEDVSGRSHTLGLLAQIELERGNVQLGIGLTREAIAMSESPSALRTKTQNIYRLAEALLRAGELRDAEETSRRAIALTRVQRDRMGEAYGLRALGEAQWRQNLVDEAEESLRDAHEAAEDVGDRFLQARVEVDLACVKVLRGEHGAARVCLHRALAVFRRLNAPVWEERALHLRDLLDGLSEDLPASIGRLTQALDVP